MKKEENTSEQQGQEVRRHLRTEFQKMKPKEAAPAELKKQVFDTLDTIQLMADMADLFTVKFSKSESEMMDLLSGKGDKNNKDQSSEEDK